MKLLAGVYQPDQGRAEVDGKAVSFHSPLDAQRTGIAVMHQHPGLFPDLSVAENIFIGHPLKGRFGRLHYGWMAEKARELLETVGLACDPVERLGGLSTSEQQLVEITRALSLNSRVLIMLSAANLTALSLDAALLIIVAVAQMLVIITRNIDLSVASVIGWQRTLRPPRCTRILKSALAALSCFRAAWDWSAA